METLLFFCLNLAKYTCHIMELQPKGNDMDENTELSISEVETRTSLKTKLVSWALVGGLTVGAFALGRYSVNTDDE